MKLSLRLLLLLPFIFVMVGCPGDDAPETVPVRSYSEVYAEDIAEIEDFMDEHFMTVDGDNNVTFTKITPSTPGTPISDGMDNSANQDDPAKPLKHKVISKGGVDHKLYFIKLEEGIGNTLTDSDVTNDNPTKLDSIYTAYKGHKIARDNVSLLTSETTFEEASNPIWFELPGLIQGWQEIFPDFKIGNSSTNPTTGITTFSGYGAGVMFIPSGLGYFNQNADPIPGYTSLIFSFKLMKLRYKDQDGDNLLSKDEYLGTGLVSGTAIDSDGDGKPNYGDFDDDNDGTFTKNEYKDKTVKLTSNPSTPISIPTINGKYIYNQLPDCSGNQFVSPIKPKHLDPSCQ